MQLNYKKFGEGYPIIILHGLFGMLDNWQSIAQQLAPDFTVYLVDQRNHGKSPHSRIFDYYTMSEDLVHFLNEQELEKVHLIGHSMGGKVAMQFAIDYPEHLSKLIIVDIAPKNYPPGHQEIFDALNSLDLSKISSRKDALSELGKMLEEQAVIQFLLKNLARTKTGTYEWKFNLPAIEENYTSILENTLTPYDTFEQSTLFVKGGNSPRYIVPNEDLPFIQQIFPTAQLSTIPNAGHWIHAEQPQAFLKTIKSFINT